MTPPKVKSEPVLASSNGEEDFWWHGEPGQRGAVVFKTDRFGQRWALDVERTHWVTQRVAAGLLNVTVMTVGTWIRQGKIKGAKRRKVVGDLVFKGTKVSFKKEPSVSVIPLKEIERLAEERGIFRETPLPDGRLRPLTPADLKQLKGGEKNADQG